MDALNRTYYEHGCYYGSGMDALNRTYYEHGCYYGSGMDALSRTSYEHGCYYGSGRDALNRTYYEHGCFYAFGVGVCHARGGIHAMRGGSSIFEPSTGPKVLFVPRRPVPKGLGENAFLRVYGPSEPVTKERHVITVFAVRNAYTGLRMGGAVPSPHPFY